MCLGERRIVRMWSGWRRAVRYAVSCGLEFRRLFSFGASTQTLFIHIAKVIYSQIITFNYFFCALLRDGTAKRAARDVKGGNIPSATPYSDEMVKELLEFCLSKYGTQLQKSHIVLINNRLVPMASFSSPRSFSSK